jgi:pimeloyl-ACP methyl ester carboxylesterase
MLVSYAELHLPRISFMRIIKSLMPIAADIYYNAYREGDADKLPVVLIHGAGGTHLYWPSELRRLLGYRVFALDLPGHGGSSGRGQQSIEAYVQSILAWLEAVGLHQAVFVGHSMGGAIVQLLSLNYSEHVLGVGLIASASRMRVNPDLLESAAHPTTFHNAIDTIIGWSYGPDASEQLTELAAKRLSEIRPSVLHGDFLACDAFDVTERINEIHQPALIVCGAEDKMTPMRNSQFLASSLPAAVVKVIPNAGHMVMLEKPQEVVAALMGFLGGIAY